MYCMDHIMSAMDTGNVYKISISTNIPKFGWRTTQNSIKNLEKI